MAPSLYIHIPFCKRKCFYCNFYSDLYDSSLASSYIDALAGQVDGLRYDFKTIYIGGGTPTALDRDLLARLLKGLAKRASPETEFTIEANPESLDDGKAKFLLDSGVNRISIGVQSLRDEKLKKLGRIHTARKALDSVRSAAKDGFKNISVDLIFGVWGENVESWKKELEEVVKLPVTHVSPYELTYEKGTPLFSALKNKSITPLDDDLTAAMYEAAIDALGLRGIKQYEVSNFAKAGYECRHNMNYWENNEYIGLGPSAVSYIDGVRSRNVSAISEYLRRAAEGKSLVESSEKLSPARRAKETAAIKIRTREGIDFRWFKDKTGFNLPELEKRALEELIAKGLIKYTKKDNVPSGIALKRKGFLFCDMVSSALL